MALFEKSQGLLQESMAGTGVKKPSWAEKQTKRASALRITSTLVGPAVSAEPPRPFSNFRKGVSGEPSSWHTSLDGVKPPEAGSWK